MSTSVSPAAVELAKSATDVNSITWVSPVDAWIGSRVRIKRTSRGISEQEFSTSLSIEGNDLAAFEAGEKRINANLLFRIAKLMECATGLLFSRLHRLNIEGGQRFRVECKRRGIQSRRRNRRSPWRSKFLTLRR
jgi:transcriptional regulator with XRE-family HTH domain